MKVLVPWSGGVDSTALILRLLKENHSVIGAHVRLLNNSAQYDRESRARSELMTLLSKFGEFESIELGSIKIQTSLVH